MVVGIASVSLLNAFLGTLYTWSVIADPLQKVVAEDRAGISTVFSTATASFVMAMLLTPKLGQRLSHPKLALCACVLATLGMLLASFAETLTVLVVGYGVLFGIANGVGYNLSLQVAALTPPHRRGFAIGTVVASYAAGAIPAAALLGMAADLWGIRATLQVLAGCFVVLALVCPTLLLVSAKRPAPVQLPRHELHRQHPGQRKLFALLWLGYALGASAGLMMIGHAAALIATRGGASAMVVISAACVAFGNCAGRLSTGWISDRGGIRSILLGAHLINACALSLVLAVDGALIAVTALLMIGWGYGILAAGYPIAVSRYYAPERTGSVYGKLFTAWGVAGFVGPLAAGYVFDLTNAYEAAMVLALAATVAAFIITLWLDGGEST